MGTDTQHGGLMSQVGRSTEPTLTSRVQKGSECHLPTVVICTHFRRYRKANKCGGDDDDDDDDNDQKKIYYSPAYSEIFVTYSVYLLLVSTIP